MTADATPDRALASPPAATDVPPLHPLVAVGFGLLVGILIARLARR